MSYYGVPSAATIASMDRRTPGSFRFSFKAPQSVTHAPDLRASVHDDARLLRQALEPLHARRKLACVLLQFANGYKPTAANESYLARAIDAFAPLPVVVEFRNAQWQNAETLDFLRGSRASLCNVDAPALEGLPHPSSDSTGPIGYIRFHGRNAATWWSGTNVTRYEYLYSARELEPWAERTAEVAAQTREAYAFFNNHARGNAPRNAEMFENILRERFGVRWEEMLARAAPTESVPQSPTLFEQNP